MRQDIIDFIHGFSESFMYGLNAKKHGIDEDIEKSKGKLFAIAISIATIFVGILTIIWGVASYVDTRFTMQGLGFVIIGIIAILIGMIIYKK